MTFSGEEQKGCTFTNSEAFLHCSSVYCRLISLVMDGSSYYDYRAHHHVASNAFTLEVPALLPLRQKLLSSQWSVAKEPFKEKENKVEKRTEIHKVETKKWRQADRTRCQETLSTCGEKRVWGTVKKKKKSFLTDQFSSALSGCPLVHTPYASSG